MFAGRRQELDRFERGIRRIHAGHPTRIVISGPAGAGKTALLGAYRRRAEQERIPVSHVSLADGIAFPPLWPWRRLVITGLVSFGEHEVAPLFARLSAAEHDALFRAFPEIAGYAGGARAAPDAPHSQAHLFSAMAVLTGGLLEMSPFVVLIDNFQLFDSSSLAMFRSVTANLSHPTVCTVLTARAGAERVNEEASRTISSAKPCLRTSRIRVARCCTKRWQVRWRHISVHMRVSTQNGSVRCFAWE